MSVLPLLVTQIAPRVLLQAIETPEQRKQIARFWMRYQRRISRFAQISERHADLVKTFPAGVFVIIGLVPASRLRQEANRLIMAGAPLSEIARLLQLPIWFRRLPPEAFSQPLNGPLPPIAFDPQVGARLLNTMPPLQPGSRHDRWLQAVLEALATGDEELAVWIGAQKIFTSRRCPPVPILPLALYVSFSRRPELQAAHAIARPWESKMSIGRAATCARQWLIRTLQDKCIDTEAQTSHFDRTHVVGGYEVVPLLTAKSLIEEGILMSHCVGSYVPYVAHGECKIYSLRRGEQRIATMEVSLGEASRLPRVTQIKGPHNATPAREIWDVATDWITERLRDPKCAQAFATGPHSDTAFRRLIWEPYASWRVRAEEIAGAEPPAIPQLLASLKALHHLERY